MKRILLKTTLPHFGGTRAIALDIPGSLIDEDCIHMCGASVFSTMAVEPIGTDKVLNGGAGLVRRETFCAILAPRQDKTDKVHRIK